MVLNRMRHPLFPHSVCGVVFQGAALETGCQFSFTCGGDMAQAPVAWAWKRAKAVAERALNGHVATAVGTATHYHTDYVSPYWASSVAKITQIGAHIFYRWAGDLGRPAAFQQDYAGSERALGGLTMAVLTRPAHKVEPAAPLITAGIESLANGRVHAVVSAEPTRPMTPRERYQALAAKGQLGTGFLAANYADPKAMPSLEAFQKPGAATAVSGAVAAEPVG